MLCVNVWVMEPFGVHGAWWVCELTMHPMAPLLDAEPTNLVFSRTAKPLGVKCRQQVVVIIIIGNCGKVNPTMNFLFVNPVKSNALLPQGLSFCFTEQVSCADELRCTSDRYLPF